MENAPMCGALVFRPAELVYYLLKSTRAPTPADHGIIISGEGKTEGVARRAGAHIGRNYII